MSFQVKLIPSGRQFEVDENESILDAAIRQDIGLPYGCRNGFCGACLSTLISGQVSYPEGEPDKLLNADEGACLPCQAYPSSDIELKVDLIDSPDEIEPRVLPVKVDKIVRLAEDVVQLFLKLPEDQRLQFLAGQYLDFILEGGKRRAFSIANPPHEDEYIELHIRHVNGGLFTEWAFNQMKEQTVLRIEAPLGHFILREDSDRPIVFIAGGTGFAPIKSQIEHAFHAGIDRIMRFYWGVRSQPDLYLRSLPEQWAQTRPYFHFIPVLSEPEPDWLGKTGWVHQAVIDDLGDQLKEYDIYMAGPPAMIQAARNDFQSIGASPDHLFYDSFEYAKD